MDHEVPGFEASNDDENVPIKKKKTKKGGGFQAMGLSFQIYKGITKRGYKVPTPIQRKAIPLALEGRDIVAMARTGSGKTACFLIPMFEKLKMRTSKIGARALILSPTRELALQTLKFVKEIGRFTGLRAAVILGGDSMDNQFSAIHGNPDILVATPGRFLHICVEMDLKLSSIEYIVFDEADRLFEMGFGDQLKEIVNRLPETRQTLLFSATLPKVLVEFAKAGLYDPVLIRLDVESKLPDELTLTFITCRLEEKVAALLLLLKSVVPIGSQTVIFATTKHHVEYLHTILDKAGIVNTFIYSDLDPSARKINTAKFSLGKVKVLIVTDVAARGIDIPSLDNVINFNFPGKAKLFVHRVGRCARAGRTGTAYSLVSPDEYAHLLDLHLFLGRPFKLLSLENKTEEDADIKTSSVGSIPQGLLEEQHAFLIGWHENDSDLVNMRGVCDKAYEQYIRSRPAASSDSNRRIKDFPFVCCASHPIFKNAVDKFEEIRSSLLNKMKNYRPQGTIFEIGTKNKSTDYVVMKAKRAFHKNKIITHHKKLEISNEEIVIKKEDEVKLPTSDIADIKSTFSKIIEPKKRKMDALYKPKKKKQKVTKDEDNYIPYAAPDVHTEQGLAVNTFAQDATRMELDLTADSSMQQRFNKQLKRWDRKKKKMVGVNQNSKVGKIRTESGVWISATYKSNRYAQWKEKNKVDAERDNNSSGDESNNKTENRLRMPNTHWARHNQNMKEKQRGMEFKRPEQILKSREIAERKKKKQQKRKTKKKPKRKN